MTDYCYVIVDSDASSRLIAFSDADLVYPPNWRDNRDESIEEWENINKRGVALTYLMENGWTPFRESPMAPEWTKNKSGVSHSLAILQKE